MRATRYTNKNNFTIFLPTPRGGQVAFHQGQGTTDAWYAKFLGHRQLTAEACEVDERGKIRVLSREEAKRPTAELEVIVAHTSPTHTQVFVDEETPEFRRIRGVLHCKLCDVFRTGSSLAMKEHIEGFHGHVPAAVEKQAPVTEVSVPSTTGDVTHIEAPKPEGEKPAEVTTPMGDVVFACPHPGCDKRFVNAKGLAMHMRRMHTEK